MRKVLALLVALTGVASADDLTVQDLPDHAIEVSTPFETVQIDPDNGGRVRSFVLKSTGDNLTWWDPTSKTGGLLDERGRWSSAHFTATTVTQTARKYVVALSADGPDGVHVTKTLAFDAVAPVIEVTYRFENRGREAIESRDPPLFVRSFIRPASGKSGADDVYSLPMSEGVVHATAKTFIRHPDTADKVWTRLADGWGALVNQRKAQGLAIVFEDDAAEALSASQTSGASTLEWAYRTLERDKYFESKLLIVPVSGMRAIQHANATLALNVLPDAIEAMGVWQALPDVKLVVRDVDGSGKPLAEHDPIALGTLPLASAARIRAKLPPTAPGTVTRELHVSNDRRELAMFREPATTGVPRALQRATVAPSRHNELADVAPPPPFTPPITEADRQRGFALFQHDTESTSHSLDQLDFDLAPELRDSQVIGVWPLAAGAAIPVELEPSASADAAWLAAHVLVRCEIEIPPPRVTRTRVDPFHQLWPVKMIKAPANHETPLWITIRGRDLAPGDYAFELRVGATRVPMRVKVWPVTLPKRPRVNLEMEHALLLLPGSDVKAGPPTTLDLFLDDLTEHGVNTAQLQPIVGNTLASVTVKDSGEPLSRWLRDHQDSLDKGPFPELEFSKLNPWVDAAIAHGMTRVTTNYGDLDQTFHTETAQKWYLRELRKWLLERGFGADETYIKVMDEVHPDQLLDLARAMTLVKDAGWKPFSTFSTVLRYPRLSRAVAGAASAWQFAGWPGDEYAERTATHDVPADQEMWTYIGNGTAARTYQAMRSHGWEVALARLDGFHGHEYYRWAALAAAAIVTIDNDRPIDSPAWEGIADGIADARLLAELIHRLDGRARLRGHLADAEGPAAHVVGPIVGRDKHAILRVGIRRANDMDVTTLLDADDVATIAKYRTARRAVLEKLAAKP